MVDEKIKEGRELVPLQAETTLKLISDFERAALVQAKEFVKELGLPDGALVRFLQTLKARSEFKELFKKQRGWKRERKAEALRWDLLKDALSEKEWKMIDEFVAQRETLYEYVSILQFGSVKTPYERVEGLKAKLERDLRCLKSIETVVEEANLSAEDPYARASTTISFWTGETFKGTGVAVLSALKAKFERPGSKRKITVEDVLNSARTRSLGDAARKALPGFGLLVEEAEAGYDIEGEVVETTKEMSKAEEPTDPFKLSKQDFLAYIRKTYKIEPQDILEEEEKWENFIGKSNSEIWAKVQKILARRGS